MKHEDIKSILSNEEYVGKNVTICGWIKTIRRSKNISFVEINDGTSLENLQLVVDNLNEKNKEFFEHMNVGSSMAAKGNVVASINRNQKVELNVEETMLFGECSKDYPIQKKKQNMEFLREIPHLRAMTNTFNALFRIRNCLSKAIHDYFQEHNFTYVHTPIITGSDCEGAGKMFRVTTLDIDQISKNEYDNNLNKKDFFGKKVGLTVSGQLEAEAMACCMGKVYTFGPTFRAENSNTKRHAAEFWMIEPEVAFADLYEIVELVVDVFKYMMKKVLLECPNEIKFFTAYYDNSLFDRLVNVIECDFGKLEYSEAIKILERSGVNFEFPIYWGCDLKSEHIKYLTDVIYKKPFFILNSPKDLKPFYQKENEDGKTVASADLFFPGVGDIIGACQKEDDFDLLEKKIENLNMTKEDYMWYLDLRKYGSVPHSGFGMGLERLVMFATGMDNIRDTIPFPRAKCKKLKL